MFFSFRLFTIRCDRGLLVWFGLGSSLIAWVYMIVSYCLRRLFDSSFSSDYNAVDYKVCLVGFIVVTEWKLFDALWWVANCLP